MPSADPIRSVFQQYADALSKGDVDAIVALYAEAATIEDPIGSPIHRGHAAIRSFYEASAGMVQLELEGAVRVAGSEGACAMIARPQNAAGVYIETLDTMSFDDAGLVTSMRAYWSPETSIRKDQGGAS